MRLAPFQDRTRAIHGALTLITFLALSFSAFADDAAFADDDAAIAKLRALPPGQFSQWQKDGNASHDKQITTVVLTQRGAYIYYADYPNMGDYSKPPIPFDHVLAALAALPKDAWPYGRLIVFYPFPPGLHSASEQMPSQLVAQKVEAELKVAGMHFLPAISV
jgi:hypothetical protein